ncbi:fructose-2,6-bisphosphatase TIGAR isoform 2-T2 [Trichechus inunguis]|uniref:Fructose-2,6-bisphosphatase TIGAR n=1 Tax=Trichechus manatus latirostris TaxID=127582 RepID=A0A2Y9R7L6_TRIMA|nr:fructose-2,6-bisphosphatase TIGAR isoform X2 [Trichechus manatus latirostris]
MTRFALTVVRHGETRFNKEKIIQGQGVDEPLSETGFKQAAAAGLFLNNVKFTHVFSSDLTRTKQTMHGILEKSMFCKDMTVKYDSRLRERVKMRGKDFFEFLCQLILKEADQKEQFSQGVPGRLLETSLAEIFPLGKNCGSEFNSHDGTTGLVASVLVVSHGAYMRSLFSYFLTDLKCSLPATLSKSELMLVSPNTGMSLFIINFEEGKEVKPTIQCICMNLQDHLNGMTETR